MDNLNSSKIILKTTGFILRNINNVNSVGLYNGKAGISLSLFIASEFFQDEYMEEKAYNLLLESLVISSRDISFENGLSGIGYVLLYLIENKYLDAKFDEMFGKECEDIIKAQERFINDPAKISNMLKTVFFLTKLREIKRNDNRIQEIIKKIFEGNELFFTIHFNDFMDINYRNVKIEVLNSFKTYLKTVYYSDYPHFSRLLIEDFATLSRKGRIASSLEIGYYLKKITEKYFIKGCEDILSENISNEIKNLHPFMLSVKEKIDYQKIMNDNDNEKEYEISKNIDFLDLHSILNSMERKYCPLGYGDGLSRLLIYLVNKDIELL